MEQSENLGSQEQENLAGQVMESLGEPEAAGEEVKEPVSDLVRENDAPDIKKRLGMQHKRHQKEMRQMQDKLHQLESRMSQPTEHQPTESFTGQPQGMGVDEQIQKAVAAAMRAKDDHENAKKHAESQAHVHKQYQELQDDLDKASEKYEDFDDVVRSPDAPFSESIRDVALLLPNRADVLYKLGKNKEELKRISALHPIEQAKEMVKLSVALMGGTGKSETMPKPPMGQIKSNPVASHAVNEKTSVTDIRNRMKSGGWK